jgi:anti-anti-sigma factor
MRLDQAIDRDRARELEAWVDEKLAMGERLLVLHCGRVRCFDSVGLETLLSLTRAAASQSARLALAHLGADLKTTLRVTRLENAIEHFATTEEAVRAMRGRNG